MSPRSPFSTLEGIFNVIDMAGPKSILDVGVGFGGIGFLIRQYFDLRPDKKKGFADWSIKMDGIEIFEKYLTPVHDYIYNDIFIGEAISIISEQNIYYELMLAIDIIEHFNKDDGRRFIEVARGRTDTFIVSTPYIYHKQDAEFYNKYEEHCSGWDASDFKNCGCRYIWRQGVSIIAVFTDKKLDLPGRDAFLKEHFDEYDLIKIKQLVNMYQTSIQFQACAEACEKYFSSFPDDYEFPLMAALCYEKLGQPGKAIASAEMALKIRPSLKIAKEIIKHHAVP